MSRVYGYARVSTKRQNLERQIQNIYKIDESAIIISEKYSGTTQNRPEWQRLKSKVQEGDTIIFDEVSRMSRTAEEGYKEYRELYNKGVRLVFNKQRHLDTDTFKATLSKGVPMTETDVDVILKGVNEYLMILAERQIQIAFEQAECEVDLLHKRISEGIARAEVEGKRIGTQRGATWNTKKSIRVKELIQKHSRDFNGSLSDEEVIKLAECSRNSYYKYKRELRGE